MSTTYTRDELLNALRVVSHFLEGLPASLTFVGDESPMVPPVRDGVPTTAQAHPLRDGRVIEAGYDKHAPQPPRKVYSAGRVKGGKTLVDRLPRAARRISELVVREARPLTSHEIMDTLQMARPTFDNAMSLLLRSALVVAEPVR